jgi:hypothetical protein
MMRHLTSTNPALEAAYRATPPGMAHWAGSGPVGRTCGQCLYLVGHKRKHHRCYKYFQLMGRWSGEIARVTASCRHFEANY